MSYANGITTNYSYNDNGWLSQIASNENVINLAFTYDAIGNITKSANLIDDAFTETYGYDAISQLTSFKRGTTVDNSYQFDPLGNRLKVIENGVVTNYTSNRINGYSSISGGISFTPQYDANGNLLNDQDHQYKYDLNNMLIGADTNLAYYAYDALGRRISKTTSSGTILFYYVGDQMVEEYNGNKLAASYLYGDNIDEALQMKKGNNVYYYNVNQLGSTMALSDKEGNITERIAYEAYGNPTFFNASGSEIAESAINNQILFTGREYNAETKTIFFRARTQHPIIGRFMQKDSLLYIDGYNDYLYVRNSPTNYMDPDGKFVQVIAIPVAYVLIGQGLIDATAIGLGLYMLTHPIQPVNPIPGIRNPGNGNRGGCWDPTYPLYNTRNCKCVREPWTCCGNNGSIFN
jgi:RHS repeat-associated protein